MNEEQISLKVNVNNSDANAKLDETSSHVEKVGEKAKESGEKGEGFFSGLGGGIAKLGLFSIATMGAAGAGEQLVDFLGESMKKSEEAQSAFAILGNTLKNNVPGWTGNSKEIEEYVDKQKLMGFSTEDITQSLGGLTIATHNVEDAQKLQGLAMDLARSKNLDLATASKLVTQVDEGRYGALSRYGIIIDKHASKEQALAAIYKAVGGSAQTYSETSAGAMAKLGAVFDNFQEQIGNVVVPLVTNLLSGLADFISSDAFQGAITGVFGIISDTIQTVGTVISNVINFVMPILQPFVSTIMGLFQDLQAGNDVDLGVFFQHLGHDIQHAWSIIQPALANLWNNLIGWIQTNGPGILAQLGTWAQAFGSWIWNSAIPALLQAAGGLISALWGWIQQNGPGILNQLATWAQAFGQWVWNTAIPALLQGLGGLWNTITGWIAANGPGILTQLGTWAQQFGAWLWDTAIPALMQGLGGLLAALWGWIQTNGPGILAQLATWTQAFMSWVMNDVLPKLPVWLGNIATALWNFITTNAPPLLAKLNEWTQKFFSWIMSDVVPKIPGWLGSIANALWTFITTNAPILYTKLSEWKDKFFDWVMKDIVPNIPIWLGNVATALWTWITTTAGDLGSKLVNEWIPSFFKWITGDGGVAHTIANKMAEAWQNFTNWVTATAKSIPGTVASIGSNIVTGIENGISGAWGAFQKWVMGLLGGMVDAVKKFFGIGSPSKMMAEHVGAPLAEGIGKGFGDAWDGIQKGMLDKLGKTAKDAQAAVNDPKNNPGPNSDPKNQPGYSTAPQNQPGYQNDPRNLPGYGRTPLFAGNLPPGAGASSGGSGMKSMGLFTPMKPGGLTPVGNGVTVNLYLDGVLMSPQQLSQRLGAHVRMRTVTT